MYSIFHVYDRILPGFSVPTSSAFQICANYALRFWNTVLLNLIFLVSAEMQACGSTPAPLISPLPQNSQVVYNKYDSIHHLQHITDEEWKQNSLLQARPCPDLFPGQKQGTFEKRCPSIDCLHSEGNTQYHHDLLLTSTPPLVIKLYICLCFWLFLW